MDQLLKGSLSGNPGPLQERRHGTPASYYSQ